MQHLHSGPFSVSLQGLVHFSILEQKKKKKKLVNIDEGPPRWRRNGAGISDNKKQPLALILPIRGSVVFLSSGLSRNVCVADCIWRFWSDGEVVPAAWARTHKPNKPKNKPEASKASSFGSPHWAITCVLEAKHLVRGSNGGDAQDSRRTIKLKTVHFFLSRGGRTRLERFQLSNFFLWTRGTDFTQGSLQTRRQKKTVDGRVTLSQSRLMNREEMVRWEISCWLLMN